MAPILALKEDSEVLIEIKRIFKCGKMIKRPSLRVSMRPAIYGVTWYTTALKLETNEGRCMGYNSIKRQINELFNFCNIYFVMHVLCITGL
jgi:hypothetical protein